MDKRKDNGILLECRYPLNLSKEVVRMAVSDPELLNTVYKEISEQLGMDSAMTMDYSGFYLLKQEDVEKADSFVRDEGGEMSDSGRTQ